MIDGNDADVVYRAARDAYDQARAGGGPSLIECMTYRHSGHSRADPAKYRPEGELEKWKERDPIPIYRERLRQFGIGEEVIANIETDVKRIVDEADRGVQGGADAAARSSHDGRLRRRRLRMAELTYRDAVARGIAQEMARDPDVVFLGEDVAGAGGVFKATVGLLDQFGPLRVRDTPISEQAILGAAMGAAMTGLQADRRDHVLRLLRGLLRLHRQRIPEEPLHDRTASSSARWWCAPAMAPARASARSIRRASRTGR